MLAGICRKSHFTDIMCLDKIISKPDTLVVLLGDFNGHYDPATPSACSNFGCSVYRWMECYNLFQVISEPTLMDIPQIGALSLLAYLKDQCLVYYYS